MKRLNRFALLALTLAAVASFSGCASRPLTFTATKELKYAVVPNFFDAKPGGQPVGPCHGALLIDKAGQIYVTTDTKRGILVFSPAGKFLRSFGPSHIHGAELREEHGVEYIYAARPSQHHVVKLTLAGEQVWDINYPSESGLYKDAKGFNPCAVTVGPDGAIYVADGYGANYVLKFDAERKFVKAFGGKGAEEGKFNTCHGIALDTRGTKPLLLVANRNNNRVEHWDLEGNFVRVIQKDLRMPAAVHIRGAYAVFPELQGRVTVLNADGSIAAQVGDNPNEKQRGNYGLAADQWKDGVCNSPHGASMDRDGNLLVNEWSALGHLHKFARQK